MSFLSDVFSGNFSNLGNDLAPSNIFSDTGTDTMKVLDNPVADVGLGLGVLTGGLGLLGGLGGLGGLFGAGATDAATAAAPAALGFAGDVDAGAATDLSTFLADPAAAAAGGAGGTAGSALALTAPDAAAAGTAAGGFDLGTIGPGVSATGGAVDATGAPLALGGTQAATAAAPAAAGTSNSFLGALGANTVKALENPLTDIGLGGLGYGLYQGYEQNQAQKALTAQEQGLAQSAQQQQQASLAAAQPLLNSGEALTQYLVNGTLPPQFQQQVTQWVQATKAQITQGYASRGMSSDPKQNSQLQQDLANVDAQAQTLQGQLESILSSTGQQMVQTANQLLSTGLSATNLAAEIPINIAKLNITLQQQTSSAIANFAAALNGGNRGINPNGISINLNPQTGALTT